MNNTFQNNKASSGGAVFIIEDKNAPISIL